MSSQAPRKPCDQCTRRKSIVRKKRGPKKGRGTVLDNLRSQTPEDPVLPQNADVLDPLTSSITSEGPLFAGPIPLVAQDQRQPDLSYDPSPAAPLDLDNPFLSFDEFTQNVLADNSYFSFEPYHGQQGLAGDAQSLANITPLAASYDTPQTAFTTTLGFSEHQQLFEVTPLVERSVELFFIHLYPTYPLLSKDTVLSWLQNPLVLSKPEQVLIWSICAATLIMVDSWPDLGFEQRTVSCRQYIRRCQHARIDWDYLEMPTFEDILASLFIANSLFELKLRKASWGYVREAITLASAAGLHEERAYTQLSDEDRVRRKRAWALLFITERGAVIPDGFPVSILMPPSLPEQILSGEDPTIAPGLSVLHALFSLLDFKFVKLWNDPSQSVFGDNSYSDLAILQAHIREQKIGVEGLSDVQRADVLITQQWLRLIFWQAALKQGFISTAGDAPAFTYSYPIEIAMALCEVVKTLPPVAIQAHGLGIFEKQFEVAYSLMDALNLSGPSRIEHHECLRYLLLSLSASPNSRQIYVKTLEKKMDGQRKYQSLAGVQLLREDGSGNSRQQSRRHSTAFVRPANQN